MSQPVVLLALFLVVPLVVVLLPRGVVGTVEDWWRSRRLRGEAAQKDLA